MGKDSSGRRTCLHTGCGKSFKKPAHLERHLLVHTKEASHRCSSCNASFGRLDSLQRHYSRKHQSQDTQSSNSLQSASFNEHFVSRGSHTSCNDDVDARGPGSAAGALEQRLHFEDSSLGSFQSPRVSLLGERRFEENPSFPSDMSFEDTMRSFWTDAFLPVSNLFESFSQQDYTNDLGFSMDEAPQYLNSTHLQTHLPFEPLRCSSHSRNLTAEEAQEQLATQSKQLVSQEIKLPTMPRHLSTEELFWCALRLSRNVAPLLLPNDMIQQTMMHQRPALFTILIAWTTLSSKDEAVQRYGRKLWHFSYSLTWISAGFTLEQDFTIASSMLVAYYSHLSAFQSHDSDICRKALHGWYTCRSVAREQCWRRLNFVNTEENMSESEIKMLLLSPQECLRHRLDEADKLWRIWQLREQATRVCLSLASLESQMIFQGDYGLASDLAFEPSSSLFVVLLQTLEPAPEKLWFTRSATEWQAFLNNASFPSKRRTQIGDLFMMLVRVSENNNISEDGLSHLRMSLSQSLTASSLLEAIHFAWLFRKRTDLLHWCAKSTTLFHPLGEQSFDLKDDMSVINVDAVMHQWRQMVLANKNTVHTLIRWHTMMLEKDIVEPARLKEALQNPDSLTLEGVTVRKIIYHSGAILSMVMDTPTTDDMSLPKSQGLCLSLAALTWSIGSCSGKNGISNASSSDSSDSSERIGLELICTPTQDQDCELFHSPSAMNSSTSSWIAAGRASQVRPLIRGANLEIDDSQADALEHLRASVRSLLFDVKRFAPLPWHSAHGWLSSVELALKST